MRSNPLITARSNGQEHYAASNGAATAAPAVAVGTVMGVAATLAMDPL
jgi:hypothetical protein